MSDGNDPREPPDILAYVLNELVEIKVEAAVMRATVGAQSKVIETLLCTVPVSDRPAVMALLKSEQQILMSENQDTAAMGIDVFQKYLAVVSGEDGTRSLQEIAAAVGLNESLLLSAPEAHREPMRTWLSIASEEEIAQDAAALPAERLAELLRLQGSSRPADRADDANGTKGPD